MNGLIVVLHLFLLNVGSDQVIKYGTLEFSGYVSVEEAGKACKAQAEQILRVTKEDMPFDTRVICRVERPGASQPKLPVKYRDF